MTGNSLAPLENGEALEKAVDLAEGIGKNL
jgi:hypothetical protein